jgi:putative salt-induced outer membrane protein YdiY
LIASSLADFRTLGEMMKLVGMFAAAAAVPALILSLALASQAETVTLANGDRITGKISDSDGKTLTLTTDYAGDVKVKWSSIKQLVADKPLYLTTNNKETIVGSVTPADKSLTVHTAAGQAVDVPYDQIAAIRTSEGENSYEKSQHPSWKQDWKASGTVGLALARGNSDTTNLSTAAALDRKTPDDHLSISESSIYTTSNAPAGIVTADAILGAARYDRNITEKLFLSGSGDFTHDKLQALDIRAIYTGGLGWHVINNPKTTFDVLGGMNYTEERYSGTTANPGPMIGRNLPGLTFSETFMHKFGAATTVGESASLYPDLEDINQYRVSFDANSVTKFNKWLGWQISISDRYVTNPPIANTKPNDVILSTGINLAFGK